MSNQTNDQEPTTSPDQERELTISDFLGDVAQHPTIVKYRGKSDTVIQTRKIFSKSDDENVETAVFPQLPVGELEEIVGDLPRTFGDSKAQEWIETLRMGVYGTTANSGLLGALKRPEAQFKQTVPSEAGELSGSSVGINNVRGATSGELAVLRVNSALGLGGLVQIPLWHSGFWVTMKNPSESALLNLHDRIVSEKVELARATYGRVFSNFTSFFAGHVFDFIMEHIYDSTLQVPLDEIRQHIVVNDLHTLAWGIATIIWPNGWQYSRSIIGDPEQAERIVNQKIRIGSMSWTDISRLTDQQRSLMSRRRGTKITIDEMNLYRSQFSNRGKRVLDLSEHGLGTTENPTKITLSVPTVDEYVNTGTRWINDIVHLFDTTAGVQGGENARNAYVRKHTQASVLRMYEHWVESISVSDDVIEDREDIAAILENISSLTKVRDLVIDETSRYIDDSTVSLIGIPSDDQEVEELQIPAFPYIIPVDPLYLFFIQLAQKVRSIIMR